MDENLSIVAVSRYGSSGASTRVRMYDWFEHLGLEADRYEYVGTADNQAATLVRAAPRVLQAEVQLRKLVGQLQGRTLLLNRSASPFSSGTLETALLKSAAHSVYDFDDAIYIDGASSFQRFWSAEKAWTRSVRAADVVIAGSEVLAEEASKFRDDVVMIPSCVEPFRYGRKASYEISENPRAVWIGSPATEPFLARLSEELLALNSRYGLRLSVISAGNSSLGRLDSIIDRHAWVPDTFYEQIASADIGLMPLPDTPLTRGKCAYKLLQYGAAGLPVVGTPVGANTSAIQRMGGLAAGTPSEWGEAIASIIEMNDNERSNMGARARVAVEKHYSFGAWATEWLNAVGVSPKLTPGHSRREP